MSRLFLLCDDHAIMIEAISGMLEAAYPDCNLLAATNFEQAWQMCEQHRPDLIICDLMMPGCPPREGIAGILARQSGVPICVLTGSQDEALMIWLLKAGIDGFVGKYSSGEVIRAAVQLILAGGRYIPEQVLQLVGAPPTESDPALVHLTPQQRRVLGYAAKGHATKEIAAGLNVAPSTIKTHLEQAMRALGASTRYEAVHRARELGLI